MYRIRSSLIIGSTLLLTALAGGDDALISASSFISTNNHPVTPATEPAAGRFLVARRTLDDPHFRQTVIYLLRHGPSGTVGLIINRPSGLNLSDALSDIDGVDLKSRPLFFGGPVEFTTVSMLIRNEQENRLVEHIAGDVYLSGDRSVMDRLLSEKKPDNALHFYLGHADWLPDQLAREIRHDNWYVIDADPAVIFSTTPESIWKRLIEKLDPSGLYAGNDWIQAPRLEHSDSMAYLHVASENSGFLP
ncbi:MAG: YqgE/AlgH family protein [Anaerobacillus sp.]